MIQRNWNFVFLYMEKMSIYSSMEKLLHIKRILAEKFGRDPTPEELSQVCKIDPESIVKILRASDGFGCS